MIICLAGFSGSGKSTLLQSLREGAAKDWNFSDLDELVFSHLKKSLSLSSKDLGEAIHAVGLEKFRCTEFNILKQTLVDFENRNLALSLGGGTLGRGASVIKETSGVFLVGLDVSFETCWQRIAGDQNRPLTKLGKERMHEKFTRRRAALLGADLVLTEDELESPPSLQSLLQKLKAH